jgi:predicted regulator of Ras-like GTPase activity (Roadblock/LC7/MglB family)
MSDGLLVAGDLPPPLKSETMAAFLPQIFGRLAHYSAEIQLGPPSALTLLAGQTPCTIFKTGALYLAVLGKPGETLPDALLQRVAGELAKRNQ